MMLARLSVAGPIVSSIMILFPLHIPLSGGCLNQEIDVKSEHIENRKMPDIFPITARRLSGFNEAFSRNFDSGTSTFLRT